MDGGSIAGGSAVVKEYDNNKDDVNRLGSVTRGVRLLPAPGDKGPTGTGSSATGESASASNTDMGMPYRRTVLGSGSSARGGNPGDIELYPSERVAGVEELLRRVALSGGLAGGSIVVRGGSGPAEAAARKGGITIERRGWGVQVNGKWLGSSPVTMIKFVVSRYRV